MTDKPFSHEEDDRFAARLGRYARVSTSAAGIVAALAGGKLSGKDNKTATAAQIKNILGNLRGPLVKAVQLLAAIPEALPPEYAEELSQLQANAPPMGWPFVRRRMMTELGADWQSRFAEFGKDAAAAASLGQVHKAKTHDGRIVACKLQYPDMESAVSADLTQLRMILGLFEKMDGSVFMHHIAAEIAERLHEELDYTREAKHCAIYGEILKNEKNVYVPEFVPELSTGRLLTCSWMDGKPMADFKKAPQKTRNKIAENLFRAWYVPFFDYGIIHGDPHMGNYTVRDDCSLNLLDYGCIRVFPGKFVKGVIDLYHGLQREDRDMIVKAFEIWGFTGLSDDLIDTLTLWARFLYSALLDDKKRLIGRAEGGFFGRELASNVHKKLQAGGGVTIPPEFVFVDRAALGLGSVFIHLRAEVNWYELFNDLIKDFDVKDMEKRQAAVLKKVGLK